VKAAVLRETGKPLVIEEMTTPKPGPGEVLVQTRACGISAINLHIAAGWGYTPDLPFVMGQEASGVVAAIGPEVVGFAVGDRVIPNIFYTCRNCRYCRTGRETLCTDVDGILGVSKRQGAFAEYFVIPARQLFHLPACISFADGGVIADAVVSAVHAVRRRAQLFPGDRVLVLGAGGVGLSVMQAAIAAGASVIVADIADAKLEHARRFGATHAFRADVAEFNEWIKQVTNGEGVDVAFDCHGSAGTLCCAVNALRKTGRLVIIGYTQDTYPLAPQQLTRSELEIVGSRSGGHQDTADAIALVGSPSWRSIVSNTFPLDEINDAFAFMRSGAALGRVVITMD